MSAFGRAALAAMVLGIALHPQRAALAAATPAQISEIQSLLSAGKSSDALKRAEQGLKSDPSDAQLRFLRAMAMADAGRHSDAIKAYQKLIEDRPELPGPRNNLAVLYAQKGQYDKARVTLEAALRSHPVYGAAYDNLGDLHARLASQSYAKALQLGDAPATPPASTLVAVKDVGMSVSLAQAPSSTQTAQAHAARPAAQTVAAAPPPAASPGPSARPPATTVVPAATPMVATTQSPSANPGKSGAPSAGGADNAAKNITAKVDAAKVEAAKAEAAKQARQDATMVRDAVNRWAAAWSRKDVDAYIAAYHPSYNGGKSRSAWVQDRKSRILGKSKISVTVSGMAVEIDGDRAKVQFRQRYRSDRLDADTTKSMRLVRVGNKWLIDRESAGS